MRINILETDYKQIWNELSIEWYQQRHTKLFSNKGVLAMSEFERGQKNFIGFEYKEVTAKRQMESIYIDSYPSFGWEFESSAVPLKGTLFVSMKFKRNRKLRNKSELARLQRQFDAGVNEIASLEQSKVTKASGMAYGVGIIGTAFMAGSVFAVVAGNIPLCIILAIPAFIGWIVPYWIYRNIVRKKTIEVTPIIEAKYDEIYEVCANATKLLDLSED